MNDAVADVIAERETLDRGFFSGVLLSLVGHVLFLGTALLAAWLGARGQDIKIPLGAMVPLPAGGGGPLEVVAGAPVPVKRPPEPEPRDEPPVEAPPKVIKPPREEPTKKALPDPEAKKSAKKPTPAPAPPTRAAAPAPRASAKPGPPGATTGARSVASATPGLGIVGPVGPGVPGGADPNGDWYLASVQRKIWTVWMRQIQTGFVRPLRVSLTINADGSLGPVQILESSGNAVIDMAAQRAVFSAAPFSALPRHYATDRITIQALFQPLP